jgi:hypothetical protein
MIKKLKKISKQLNRGGGIAISGKKFQGVF